MDIVSPRAASFGTKSRPFRDGPSHVHVGLSPLQGPWLLPGISTEKAALLADRPGDVFACEASSGLAQKEALDAVAGATGAVALEDNQPLLAAAALIEPDLVVMERQDENWRCTAACLCAPTYFTPQHAVGKSLSGLHGPVPGGAPGLSNRISRVFDGLRADLILERQNWTVQAGPERHTPNGLFLRERALSANLEDAAALLYLRVERQTIRRLPATGSVLFTIDVTTENLATICEDAADRAAFRAAWDNTPPEVAAYKGWGSLERLIRALFG